MQCKKRNIQILDGPRQGALDKARPSCLHVVVQRMQWRSLALRKDQNGHCVESFDPVEWFLELLLK